MKHKKIITTIILFAVSVTAFGQQYIGIKINGGLSYISTENKVNPSQPMSQIFYPMFSGQGGLTYNYVYKNRFQLGTELLYTQLEGKEYFKFSTGMFANEKFISDNGYSESISFRHVYCLGLPVYVGYNFYRFNLNLGFQTNLVLVSRVSEKGQVFHDGQFYTWDNKGNDLGIKRFDFGGRIGLFYKLSDKYSIESNYYYGLRNLTNSKMSAETLPFRVQQWTVGLRYKLVQLGNREVK